VNFKNVFIVFINLYF